MAFAQLTGCESLRAIEASLAARPSKLYPSGFRAPVRRPTLADANERRDWRIYADFGQRLISQARTLYAEKELATHLQETVYTLGSSTVDLCLPMFPRGTFRTTKAAIKLHALPDLRGSIPSFIHISEGKLHDVNVLDLLVPEAGATYVMDRAYVDFRRLHRLHQAGAFFVTRAKRSRSAHRLYSALTDRTLGVIADQTAALDGVRTKRLCSDRLRRIRYKDPQSERTLVFLTNRSGLDALTICDLYQSRWQVELLFKWVMYHWGVRVSEAARLTVGDLQLAGNSADRSLATVTGKGGKTRLVPLLPSSARALGELARGRAAGQPRVPQPARAPADPLRHVPGSAAQRGESGRASPFPVQQEGQPAHLAPHGCDPHAARERGPAHHQRLAGPRQPGHDGHLRRDRSRNEGEGGRRVLRGRTGSCRELP